MGKLETPGLLFQDRASLAADLLETLEGEEDLRDLAEARAEVVREGTIPWEKAKSELGLK